MNQELLNASTFLKRYRVKHGKSFRLADIDPADTQGLDLKDDEAKDLLEKGVARLSDLQRKLFAQDRWALLLIFQAMDAAGKDSVIRHVMSGVNPQGCQVYSFKQPSQEDLNHDFLWRASKLMPERGHIGIFNRSYYEEVLVVRVHPELLANERLPHVKKKKIWRERFEDINSFETYLDRDGILLRKFFLYVSKEEQKRRFLSRLDEPDKNWKFSEADVRERERWDDYMSAYEDMIRHTATPRAPWFVVPADQKWFTRLVVASIVIETLERLHLTFPRVDEARKKELETARELLLNEGAQPTDQPS